MENRGNVPIVVTFYTATPYYEFHAERFRQSCLELGVDHHIQRIDPEGEWSKVTSMKPRFVWNMLREFKRPVFWLDADTTILKASRIAKPFYADFGGWFRSRTYVRDDQATAARKWMACGYCAGYTKNGLAFWERVIEAGTGLPLGSFTDDFMLESAWRSHEIALDVQVFPPSEWVIRPQDQNFNTEFIANHSGNVAGAIGRVRQHRNRKAQLPVQQTLAKNWAGAVLDAKAPDAELLWRSVSELGGVNEQNLVSVVEGLLQRHDYKTASDIILDNIKATEQPLGTLSNTLVTLLAQTLLLQSKYSELLEICGVWRASYLPRVRKLGEYYSSSALIELEESQKESSEARLPAYWMDKPFPGNFGDLLTPYVLRSVTGRWPRLTSSHGLMGIGSTLKLSNPKHIVWGTGLSRKSEKLGPQPRIASVRGPITKRVAEQSGWMVPSIYGDGALMLPSLYEPDVQIQNGTYGIVPHIVHEGVVRADRKFEIVSLEGAGVGHIEMVIDKICSHDVIASSSLHGLIVALAYGRDAIWVQFPESSKGIAGDDMKFYDFFQSLGLTDIEPLRVGSEQVLNEALLGKARRIRASNAKVPDVSEPLLIALAEARDDLFSGE